MTAVSTQSPSRLDRNLERVEALGARDHRLAVSVTVDAGGSPQVAVVNIAIVTHPHTNAPCVAFVSRRGAKLANLRRRPQATLVVRASWEWIAVSGRATLIGPDDPDPAVDEASRQQLFRAIYRAAGGDHPDLAAYDRVMVDERRCAVLVEPERFTTNPPGSEHVEP